MSSSPAVAGPSLTEHPPNARALLPPRQDAGRGPVDRRRHLDAHAARVDSRDKGRLERVLKGGETFGEMLYRTKCAVKASEGVPHITDVLQLTDIVSRECRHRGTSMEDALEDIFEEKMSSVSEQFSMVG